jgi:hypothetical protein
MFHCRSTKRPVFTGFYMDETTFQSADFGENRAACQHCGSMHPWSKPDAFLLPEAFPGFEM